MQDDRNRMDELKEKRVSIKTSDWLLILSVVFAPMTGFRVWKLGPAEFFAFAWCIRNAKVYLRISRGNAFVKFWLPYLMCSMIGSIICVIAYPIESRWKDMLTWVYMALVSFAVYSVYDKKPIEELRRTLEAIAKITVVFYIFVFVYAQRSRTMLGAPLWLGRRFTGGSDNPHQVALLLVIVVITGLWMYLTSKGTRKRIEAGLVSAGAFYLLLQTYSSTGLLAVTIGTVVMLFESWVRRKKYAKQLRIAVLLIIGGIVLLNIQMLMSTFYNWIASDANGLGRLDIFATYPDTFWKSPLFGLGPGVHGRDGNIEFHNTYLEVLAMSGMLGGMLFLVFSANVLKCVWKSSYALGVLGTLYAFGFAGFSMRRLVFWIILSIIYAYSRKLRGNEKY